MTDAPVRPPGRTVGVVLTVLAGCWLVAVTVAGHAAGLAVDQVVKVLEVHEPWWVWPSVAWLPAIVAAIPAVLLATLSLFIFGGGAINDFAFAFLVGIITGTYSSIYIASALVLWWHRGERPRTGSQVVMDNVATARA